MPQGSVAFAYASNKMPSGERYDSYRLDASPGVLYFLKHGIGVGGSIGFLWGREFSSVTASSSQSVGLSIRPEIAYNIPLRDQIALMPRLWARYVFERQEPVGLVQSVFEPPSVDMHRVTLGLFLPVFYAMQNGVFFGMGPDIGFDVLSRVQRQMSDVSHGALAIEVQLRIVVGGWL